MEKVVMNSGFQCRFCHGQAYKTLVDLGETPLANAYVSRDNVKHEASFPLKVNVCRQCLLAQLPVFKRPDEIFSDYAYFSSFSESWLQHAKQFCELALEKLAINQDSFVVEIASNDGYLLKNFAERGIPHLGIEPAQNIATVATNIGVNTKNCFFNSQTANDILTDYQAADLIIANNVIAHVDELNDFVASLQRILSENGSISCEFPHLQALIEECQFDTIYHEHFSYFSLHAVQAVFKHHGLIIYDVEQLPTHGGSLRIWAAHLRSSRTLSQNVQLLLQKERLAKLDSLDFCHGFQLKANAIKNKLIEFLTLAKKEHKSVAAYGAAAKGNTMLNFCQINSEDIAFVCDKNPVKQGLLLPGSHVPIVDEQEIKKCKPDYILILPWNLAGEIKQQLAYINDWGAKFVVAIPTLIVSSE